MGDILYNTIRIGYRKNLYHTGHALQSKSLLGRSSQPLVARNHCSAAPRNHLAFQFIARASFFVFHNIRKRRYDAVFSYIPSKSRLGHARQPLGAKNHCSGMLLSNLALGAAARTRVVEFDSNFIFPVKTL